MNTDRMRDKLDQIQELVEHLREEIDDGEEVDRGTRPTDDALFLEQKTPNGRKFSERSLTALRTVDAGLQRFAWKMLCDCSYDFVVIEGLRTQARQEKLYKEGSSRTMNSYHLTGHAFDFAVLDEHGKVTWDKRHYDVMGTTIKMLAAGHELFGIRWGGDFAGFYDGGHVQMQRSS